MTPLSSPNMTTPKNIGVGSRHQERDAIRVIVVATLVVVAWGMILLLFLSAL